MHAIRWASFLIIKDLIPTGAVPDASMMDTMFFVPAGPADQMKAMTLQDLLGDDGKGAQAPVAPPSPVPPAAPPAPGGAWSAVKQLASAAAGEAAHLAHEASHLAQEAVRSAAQAAAAKQEERRWADEIAAKRRAAALKKGGRGSRQEYRVEIEAPESNCSIYAFTNCNGFERSFINSAQRNLKKLADDISFWESEISRGVTSTPKGQMRYSTMVHLLKELKQYGEEKGEEVLKSRWKNSRFDPHEL